MASETQISSSLADINSWIARAEVLLLNHWGDVGAFQEPRALSIAELMAEDFEPQEVVEGKAVEEARSLELDWLQTLDRKSSAWKERAWELSDLWVALQEHRDGTREIEDLQEFKARLTLRRMKVGIVFKARPGQEAKPEDYFTNVQSLQWFRDGCPQAAKQQVSVTTLVEDSMQTLKKGWDEIQKFDSPVGRSLAMKELQKQLKVSPKDMQALIRDLQMEASQENQQFSTFSSVMQMNVGSTSLVDRLIAPATTTMIAAAGGTGKTSLTYEVMEAITTGQPAFGEFETKQANVLVIQGDESMVNARKKWTRMDLAPDESRVKFLWDWNASRLKELEAEIVKDKRELVIFDSFGTLFCGGGEALNDPTAGMYIYELNKMAARTGCAMVVTHHLGKGSDRHADDEGKERTPTHKDIFGSAYIFNGARDVWAMWRKGEDLDGSPMYGLKYLKDNSGLMERDYCFWLNGDEESHRFRLTSGGIEDIRTRNTVRSKLLASLKLRAPEWMSRDELLQKTTFSTKPTTRTVNRELNELVTDAANTGIQRRKTETSRAGRPSYQYRYGRGFS